jgi:glucose/mannose transport system substrate-binding protein
MSSSILQLAALMSATLLSALAWARPLEVLHHMEAGPDREAAKVLQQAFKARGHAWKDFAIASGANGLAASILESRVRQGNPPPVAQIKARAMREWAARGALLPLEDVARAGRWDEVLPPAVAEALKHEGRYVGVPLNIHRLNWLWINARILKEIGGQPPTSWEEFFGVAEAMQRAGYTALELQGYPSELLIVFETVVLGVGGPQFYRDALIERDPAALASPTMEQAMRMFRRLKPYSFSRQPGPRQLRYGEAFFAGRSGMLLTGDWIGPALQGRSREGPDYLCVAAPGTAASFSFAVDAFAMFRTRADDSSAQQAFAAMVMAPEIQHDFNLYKGSLPARRNVTLHGYSPCARQSALAFQAAAQAGNLVPALGTALPAAQEEALRQAVTVLWNDERATPRHVIEQLLSSPKRR